MCLRIKPKKTWFFFLAVGQIIKLLFRNQLLYQHLCSCEMVSQCVMILHFILGKTNKWELAARAPSTYCAMDCDVQQEPSALRQINSKTSFLLKKCKLPKCLIELLNHSMIPHSIWVAPNWQEKLCVILMSKYNLSSRRTVLFALDQGNGSALWSFFSLQELTGIQRAESVLYRVPLQLSKPVVLSWFDHLVWCSVGKPQTYLRFGYSNAAPVVAPS